MAAARRYACRRLSASTRMKSSCAAAVEAVLVTDNRAFLPAAAHIQTLNAYSAFELENWAAG
jgi:hypothetical protein